VSSLGSTVMGVCIVEYDVEMLTNEKPDSAFEFIDDGFVNPPSEVIIQPDVVLLDFDVVEPDGQLRPPPDLSNSVAADPPLCGPNGCDIPAWSGDR